MLEDTLTVRIHFMNETPLVEVGKIPFTDFLFNSGNFVGYVLTRKAGYVVIYRPDQEGVAIITQEDLDTFYVVKAIK